MQLKRQPSYGGARGARGLCPCCTAGPNYKNPSNIKFEKFVKLTDHACVCNDLTSFECEAQAPGNGSYVNLQNFSWKNSWNHFGRNYVLADFWHLESMCAGAATAAARSSAGPKKVFQQVKATGKEQWRDIQQSTNIHQTSSKTYQLTVPTNQLHT